MYSTYPIILQMFPLLVGVSFATSFTVVVALNRGLIKRGSGRSGWLLHHGVRIIRYVAAILYVTIIASMAITSLLNDVALATVLALVLTTPCNVLLHGLLVLFVGTCAGLLAGIGFVKHGVSGFLVAGVLLSAVPLLSLQLDIVKLLLGWEEEGFVTNWVFLFLIFSGSTPHWIQRRVVGKAEPESKAVESVGKAAIADYLLQVMLKLSRRLTEDHDHVAEKVLTHLLGLGGALGELVREIAVSYKMVGEDGQKSLGTLGVVSSFRAHPLRPSYLRSLTPAGLWTLTRNELVKRVRVNRIAYLALIAAMSVLVLTASGDLSQAANQWLVISFAAMIVASIPMAAVDPLFTGRRRGFDQALKEIMDTLEGVEEVLVGYAQRRAEQSGSPDTTPEVRTVQEPFDQSRVLASESIERLPEDQRAFIELVLMRKDEVYREGRRPLLTAVVALVLIVPLCIVLFGAYSRNPPAISLVLSVLFFVDMPTAIVGLFLWHRQTNHRLFRGFTRREISSAICTLDVSEAGLSQIGVIVYPPPPAQFALFGSLSYIDSRTSDWLSETNIAATDVEVMRYTLEQDADASRSMVLLSLALLIVAGMIPVLFLGFPVPLAGLSIAFFAAFLLTLRNYLAKLKRLKSLHEPPLPTTEYRRASVDLILSILHKEYRHPLRVIVVRNHPGLYYTGVIYITSENIQLREAVFLPPSELPS